MSDYFFEFDIPNFVDNVDILQRIRNKYKANIQDNIYNQIDEQLDFVEYIDNKIGKCELSIAKLKNSIPYKKEDKTLIVMPLWRVKDAFCFYQNNSKIKRLRFTKPTIINNQCMWGCPANDSDVWLLCLHNNNSFEHVKTLLQ
jgi:hypothetical protein